MNEFIEYIKLHIISLEQDLEDAQKDTPIPDDEYFEGDMYYDGAITACRHLLAIAEEYHWN